MLTLATLACGQAATVPTEAPELPQQSTQASILTEDDNNLDSSALEAAIEASDVDDVYVIIGNQDGILFSYGKGNVTADTRFPIASSSKWWTAATILQLVEEDTMSLDDKPQDYLDWWTDDSADERSQITLRQLLSFTSGFQGELGCILSGNIAAAECGQMVYDEYHQYTPGETFYYSSTHMHIAGLMAVEATGQPFNALFREKIADPLGMSATSQFERPDVDNPFLAGGGVSTASDYAIFTEAIYSGRILPTTRDDMLTDWTATPVTLAYSPVQGSTEWHYGLGVWFECATETTWLPECDQLDSVSSAGGLGWYPWIDFANNYYGVIARRGLPLSGALADTADLAFTIRPIVEETLRADQ